MAASLDVLKYSLGKSRMSQCRNAAQGEHGAARNEQLDVDSELCETTRLANVTTHRPGRRQPPAAARPWLFHANNGSFFDVHEQVGRADELIGTGSPKLPSRKSKSHQLVLDDVFGTA